MFRVLLLLGLLFSASWPPFRSVFSSLHLLSLKTILSFIALASQSFFSVNVNQTMNPKTNAGSKSILKINRTLTFKCSHCGHLWSQLDGRHTYFLCDFKVHSWPRHSNIVKCPQKFHQSESNGVRVFGYFFSVFDGGLMHVNYSMHHSLSPSLHYAVTQ